MVRYSERRTPLMVTGVLIMLFLIYLLFPSLSIQVNRTLSMLAFNDVKGLRMYFTGLGEPGKVAVSITMALQAVLAPLPRPVVIQASAGVFGAVKGSILAWMGVVLGAVLCFGIGRAYGRPLWRRIGKERRRERERFFEVLVLYLVFATRLLPGWPFDLVYYLAGISNMRFRDYLLAIVFSELPVILALARWGEQELRRVDGGLWMGAAVLVVLGLWAAWKNRSCGEKEP